MKIAVIAANGRTGREFVKVALAAGHTVRAGVHDSRKDTLPDHARLTVVECDATNEDDLKTLIQGQDAVTSFIGHVRGSNPDVQTIAIAKVIQVMKELGVQRIVSLTGTGVRFPGDKITFIDRLLNLTISVIDPKRVRDGRNHVAALQLSTLDWTVIRVLKLADSKPQLYSLRENGPTKPYVSRAEVADAVLEVLENDRCVHQAPMICAPQ